ncbi:hypothetical protein H696_02252 [Fonticula alba]|uniref:TauD/TfdA-like domain-containing protein n=1 Tax=Fonticula alba TaxID=691883 RepID=A0A058ZBK0_FONAL|nr:hypothetical protein H696_02252 [Fonticula alba]KCV71306.1 hypothetical protein H696_02252 [Fonticula alba]|eukprot:XP_009494429.1 hypothetical protein H696_02252 [Fonticula alba]
MWTVSSGEMTHADLAYSTVGLSAHTDNTYFSEPCGIQMFHMMQHTGTGGWSTFVDGFRIALEIRRQAPHLFDVLRQTRFASHYIDHPAKLDMRPDHTYPVIQAEDVDLDLDAPATGDPLRDAYRGVTLRGIRFNSDDRAPLTAVPSDRVPDLYAGLQLFSELARSPELVWRFPMRPGSAVIFDNQRVLHGREAFTGYRRFIGAYSTRDDWRARLRWFDLHGAAGHPK